ncbi:glycerol-3-phosphate dehydrogenase [Candidatus Rickettsiella viridis]|uniref:Glycerol-3-phosphate dehydrogenase n=1 Tax=Candidatus Rickettsiella viridis TaxID=676208 RepID=A0A2Z5V7J4_9COXI|nr:FAD-dependent oxidoreductase [Candidatus Rickettsiella viridis]BBB15447.1 glycerol-3-phosphate dehydrogenase [Candidatus Rickettsiella viridis]
MLNKSNNKEAANIKMGIIGGGIGGCMTALRLSEEYPQATIFLFEKKEELLQGTSNRTPGRMGLGFHYVDKNTAKVYLNLTIDFTRRFYKSCPHLMVGQEYPENYPLRNGRYFIVKNFSFSEEEILETYKALAEEYTRLVEQDSENKLFGEPHEFYRILNPEEYERDVNLGQVKLGVETREHLLDWPQFRKFLLTEIEDHKNIHVTTNSEIKDICFSYMDTSYSLSLKKDNDLIVEKKINFIVNATWEWTDYINSKIGYYRLPRELRTNRAKVLVKVKLPDELKEKHSMFFCMGPHCMFSNVGDGFGFITYAPETNLLNSTDLIPSKNYLDIINGQIPIEKQLAIAEKIVAGVSLYIPAMINAGISEVLFGTVQVEGEADIFDPASKVHIRDYTGLSYIEDGFISLSCMKLLYGYGNANTIVTWFNSFKEQILPLPKQIMCRISKEINPDNQLNKSLMKKTFMLTGLCFSWLIKARPVNKDPSYTVSLDNFIPNFFKKIKLNEEFHDKNKKGFFINSRLKY